MFRKIRIGVGLIAIILPFFFLGGLWAITNQLLFPRWHGVTSDLSACAMETAKYWGPDCGNLRKTKQFQFFEVHIPSSNGYELPGWLIKSADNGGDAAKGVIMLIPAGGSDRREDTRYIKMFQDQALDVLTIDLGCQGEAPCPVPGLTYGDRESRDVLSIYLYLTNHYQKVFAFGSSVGAASILNALPGMPKLTGAIIENPMASFQTLIKEARESKSMPAWATDLMINTTMLRGYFDGLVSPEHSLKLVNNIPLLFIHSKQDEIVSYKQTEALVDLYDGPKTAWYPETGSHAIIWDADKPEYERHIAEFLGQIR